ncbi:unnamed protein product [Linum trigynum]|uniref:RNase H type-1 domain-containing protein n=1 Tax=Linum trigynum TaxID=586398 RepID=A0AAV2GLD5_9ROSI
MRVVRLMCLLWRIWKGRNSVVFEGQQILPSILRQEFLHQVSEWEQLPQGDGNSVGEPSGGRGTDQPTVDAGSVDGVVCSFDGAVHDGSHAAGGVVLREAGGAVFAAQGLMFTGLQDPMLVELSTLRDAMRWCQHRGLEAVTFEGDAKIVIDKVNARDVCAATGGALFEEIRQLLLLSPGFRVKFVGRQNNRVAHMVAKKALSLFPAGCNGFDFCGWLRSQAL